MRTVDAMNQFLSNRVARCQPTTLKWYAWILGDFRKTCRKLPSSPEPIEGFLQSSHSNETWSGRFRVLRALYNFVCPHCSTRHLRRRKASASVEVCAQCGGRNPMESVASPPKSNKVMRTFSPEQLYPLFSQPLNLRDKTLLTLLLDSGIRAGEAANLTWDRVFCELIIVRGKTGERLVPISPATHHLLMQLRANNGTDGHVFMGRRGPPLAAEGIYRIVHRLCAVVGITGKRSSPQTLRHTAGTLLISAGCDLDTVRRIFGHSSTTVTEKYLHQNTASIIEKHHQFSPLKALYGRSQGILFDPGQEAEAILAAREASYRQP